MQLNFQNELVYTVLKQDQPQLYVDSDTTTHNRGIDHFYV